MRQELPLAGLEAILELRRANTISGEKPLITIHSTDPCHRAGTIYEGTRLTGIVIHHDERGKIAEMTICASQAELGSRAFSWIPEGSESAPGEMEMLSLEVHWGDWHTVRRVGMGEEALEAFIGKLPEEPDPELIREQRRLESVLPTRAELAQIREDEPTSQR